MKYGQVKGIDKPISRLVQGAIMLSADRLQEGLALLDGFALLFEPSDHLARLLGHAELRHDHRRRHQTLPMASVRAASTMFSTH